MAFDLNIWKENFKQRLPAWRTRLQKTGVKSIYFTVSAAALWPIVEAYKQGDLAALFALGGVLAGLGSNLLANQIQTWKDETDAATQLVEAVHERPELRAELDAVLEKLDALTEARTVLPPTDRPWFEETLREELARLGSQVTITYQATATNQSAIAQGTGSKAVTGTLIEGGVQGNVTIHTTPAPHQTKTERRAEARTKYLHRLRSKCQTLPLPPLGDDPSSQPEVSLDDVYVALNTTEAIPLTQEEFEKRKKQSWRSDFEKDRLVTTSEAVLQNPKIVLLGDPGSGKSTFVRNWLARQASVLLGETAHTPGVEGDSSPDRDLLPVLITLRDLASRLDDLPLEGLSPDRQRIKFLEVIHTQLRTDLKDLYRTPEFFEGLLDSLENGRVLLALDGLDELPERQRPAVRQVVAALLAEYKLPRLLITCRIRSYAGAAVQPGFISIQLAPFNQEQVKDFCTAWYLTQTKLEKMDEKQARAKANNLAEVALSDDLRKLAENPMLLTTMAIIHQKETRLPSERVKLYSQAVQILIERWQRFKTGEQMAPDPQLVALLLDPRKTVRKILERLAYEAHRSNQGNQKESDLPRYRAIEILEKEFLPDDLNLANVFLDYVDQRAGLLVGRGGEPGRPSTYGFPHRTFQEYLAGCYLVNQRDAVRKLRELAQEPEYWRIAVELGAEELFYNGRTEGHYDVLNLAYGLLARQPDTPLLCRTSLWAGKLTALVGWTLTEGDTSPQGGKGYLDRLIPTLVKLLESGLTPSERADAGRALAKLGDPRREVMEVDATPFCFVPEGELQLGSAAREEEQPTQEMTLPGFWIAQFPVTNAQFAEFVAAGGYELQKYWEEAKQAGVWKHGKVKGRWEDAPRDAPEFFREPFHLPNHPVVGVTWYESLAYTRWLTERWQKMGWLAQGWQVHLPSEAEWEKAARGGLQIPAVPLRDLPRLVSEGLPASFDSPLADNPFPTRAYPWGDEFDANATNIAESRIETTSAVGCFPSGVSPYGVEEMSGNVWEWTRSIYKDYPYDPHDGREALADKEAVRVLRGGAFRYKEDFARCSFRYFDLPDYLDDFGGFRLVVSPFLHDPGLWRI